MKILITGAAGDIGSRLVDVFKQDSEVELFTTALGEIDGMDAGHHLSSDIRDAKLLEWVKKIEPNVIIHLASIIQLPESMSRVEAFEVDVTATESLLKTAAESGVNKFIVTSSGAAYGYWKDNADWLTEDMPLRGNEDYFYSSHKRQVEELLSKYRQLYPFMQQVVLRPGTVLGPNFENPITNIFSKNIITGIAGSASPFVIIWVDDLVEYLIEAAKTDVEGVFNVAGNGTLTLKQIAGYLNKPYIGIPSWFLRGVLSVLKPLGVSQYGPEQVKFIEFRPVLSNTKIKQAFKHQPQKSTEQAFFAFLEKSNKEYIKA